VTERLFFALWPGARQRAALWEVVRRLPLHQGRATHPDDFHLTLVFLGDLDAPARACAEAAAGRVRATGFTLILDHLGAFARARVLWCGASRRPPLLLELVQALAAGLTACGFRPERRPFAPHVTLARKARAPADWTRVRGTALGAQSPSPAEALGPRLDRPVEWPVAEFVLVVSLPGERPRYRVESRWPLSQ